MYRPLIVLIALGFGVMLVGCQDKAKSSAGAYVTGSRKTYSHDDFEKLVKGKTAREVEAAVGPADYKVEGVKSQEWSYAGITTDPATGQPDFKTTVYFEGGRATKVEYSQKPQ